MENETVFVEKLVKKRKNAMAWATQILSVILGVFIIFTAWGFLSGSNLSFILPLLVVGIGYGVWWFCCTFEIEYEYAITEGELDIDKIIAKRKRTRILSVKCESFKAFGKVSDQSKPFYSDPSLKTKIDASEDDSSPEKYYAVFDHSKLGMTRIIFDPSDEMIAIIEKSMARHGFRR